MLCLTRKPIESIQISDDITVTVLDIKGNQVRLGIEAPENMLVLREELIEPIARRGWRKADEKAEWEAIAPAADVEAAPKKPKPKITYKRRISRLKSSES